MTETFPTIPGYRILKQMGQGGMASVYLAVQESFGREVALKIMSDQLGKDDVWTKRFMHEARVVAQLSHSNIVPVFDVGSHEGRFYISMELLKGGKLDDKMARGLSSIDAVKIVCGVAAGLDYAGAKGFVHRDIKPDNIMFRDDGTPVILDFGIAKQKDGDSKMTKTGTIVGTTGYMSPEQAMGQALDERSDIYSLGILFYELLTGHVPFRGDSAVAVLLKHVQETPPPLPATLAIYQPVLDRALAKKPEDRYARASEMIEHLQNLSTQTREAVQTSANTVVMSTPARASDVTVVTAAVTKNRTPMFIGIAVAIIAVLLFAWIQRSNKTDATTVTETTRSVQPAQHAAPEPAPESEPAADSTSQRAITRILIGARACLKKQQYDCAKSKAESALDLDPGNLVAQKILAEAEKAQKDAFSGDWNAK